MQEKQKLFAFQLATKETKEVKQVEQTFQARAGVSLAGCTGAADRGPDRFHIADKGIYC